MNKEALNQLILEALSKKLGDDFHISIQEILKTNVKLNGLTILKNAEKISPTIYLDSFYEDLEGGASIDVVINRILQTYSAARVHTGDLDIASLSDFGYVKNRLYVQLINKYANRELLADIPHSLFLDDFAVTVRCMVNTTEDGSASFLIHNSHLDIWQTDAGTLLSDALHNTRKMLGVELIRMENLIQQINPSLAEDDRSCPIWIMTNKRKLAGAATVLFDDVLKDFAKEHGSFYLIFSSVHEVLLLPTSDSADIDTFSKINQEVNASCVLEDEVLGTKAYFYSRDGGFVL